MSITASPAALETPTVESSAPFRRLRIAYVVHDFNRKFGHSRYVAELASRMKHEHEVHIFANTFEDADTDGLTLHHVPAGAANVVATLLTFLLPATWMVRGKQFDIIHAQGVCGLKQNVVTAHICQSAWVAAMAGHSGRPGCASGYSTGSRASWSAGRFATVERPASSPSRNAFAPICVNAIIAPTACVSSTTAWISKFSIRATE